MVLNKQPCPGLKWYRSKISRSEGVPDIAGSDAGEHAVLSFLSVRVCRVDQIRGKYDHNSCTATYELPPASPEQTHHPLRSVGFDIWDNSSRAIRFWLRWKDCRVYY